MSGITTAQITNETKFILTGRECYYGQTEIMKIHNIADCRIETQFPSLRSPDRYNLKWPGLFDKGLGTRMIDSRNFIKGQFYPLRDYDFLSCSRRYIKEMGCCEHV